MKQNFLRFLQVAWIALAMLTAYNSFRALKDDASYCSGMYCGRQSDCGSACFCNSSDYTCYAPGRTGF
jgi:hypothetical protein